MSDEEETSADDSEVVDLSKVEDPPQADEGKNQINAILLVLNDDRTDVEFSPVGDVRETEVLSVLLMGVSKVEERIGRR